MQVSMNIDGIIFSMAIESSPFREMIDDRENERFLFSASVTDVQGSEEEIRQHPECDAARCDSEVYRTGGEGA